MEETISKSELADGVPKDYVEVDLVEIVGSGREELAALWFAEVGEFAKGGDRFTALDEFGVL